MVEERVRLGHTSLMVSPICFGCWQMGQTFWGKVSEEDLIASVRRALNLGINFFDTADAYGNGTAERILGHGLKGFDRDSFIIATKVYYHWYDDDRPRHSDLSYNYMIWECEQSLKRLGLDYIDLYQAHAFDVLTHPEETARAFEKLKEDGKIRYAGCSNYNAEQLRSALKFGRMDTIQPLYNLLQCEAEETLFPLCMAEEIGVMTYSSLAMGLLTGKFTGKETFDDVRATKSLFEGENFRSNVEKVNRLKPIAAQFEVSVTQLVLRATISHPAVTSAIVGIKRPEQIEDAAGTIGWTLSRQDYYRIREALS